MKTLRYQFNIPIGYSDHTPGLPVTLAAVGHGACIIEKHITYDRNAEGPDHRVSIEPKELKEMIRQIREFEGMDDNAKREKLESIEEFQLIMGKEQKRPVESEFEAIKLTRKYIVATRDVKKGQHISRDMLAVKRTGQSGLLAKDINSVIGKITNI